MIKYFRWFFAVIRPYRLYMSVMLACHVLTAFCTIAFVYVSKALIDMAVGIFNGPGWGGNATSFPFTEPVSGNLLVWSVYFVLIILLRILLNSLRSWIQTKTDVSLRNSLRKRLFDNLLHIQGVEVGHKHTGDLVNRLQEDVRVVSNAISVSVPGLVGACFQFAVAFVFFVILEYRLALLVVIVLPLGLFVGRMIMVRIRNLTTEIRKSDSKVQSHVQESLQHLTVLQSLEYSRTSVDRLDDLQKAVYGNELKRTKFSIVSRVFISIAFSAAQIIAFLWGVVGISCGTVTYGLMIAFLQLLSQLQRPLLDMSSQLPSVIHCAASVDRLLEIEDANVDSDTEPVFMSGVAGVRFENVTFAYDAASSEIMKDFDFDFKPGSHTAVIGPTGVGKSTLVKLMMAFLKPSQGRVVIYDANHMVTVSPATRCNLVFVPQGNSLFSGSILDNLLMGNPDATQTQIREALETAAADFVFELPGGLDFRCFESGVGLSEGQAQRIAIARALLRPGSVLLLDEFSSALDADTETILLERLTKSKAGRTMIFITHRDKILDYCDTVLRLEDRV